MSDMQESIFTFGFGQAYPRGYVSIKARTPDIARDRMFREYDDKWSMQYDSPNAREKAGIDKYNMWEVKSLVDNRIPGCDADVCDGV